MLHISDTIEFLYICFTYTHRNILYASLVLYNHDGIPESILRFGKFFSETFTGEHYVAVNKGSLISFLEKGCFIVCGTTMDNIWKSEDNFLEIAFLCLRQGLFCCFCYTVYSRLAGP